MVGLIDLTVCPSRASLSTRLKLRPKWRIRARHAIRTNCSLTNLKSGPITRHLGREFQQCPSSESPRRAHGPHTGLSNAGEGISLDWVQQRKFWRVGVGNWGDFFGGD